MYFFFSLPSSEERLRKKIKESTFFSSLICTVFVLVFFFSVGWDKQVDISYQEWMPLSASTDSLELGVGEACGDLSFNTMLTAIED